MKFYLVWVQGMKLNTGVVIQALDSFMARQKAAVQFKMATNQCCARRVNEERQRLRLGFLTVKLVVHSVSERGRHPLCYARYDHPHDIVRWINMWAGLSLQAGASILFTLDNNDGPYLEANDARSAIKSIERRRSRMCYA